MNIDFIEHNTLLIDNMAVSYPASNLFLLFFFLMCVCVYLFICINELLSKYFLILLLCPKREAETRTEYSLEIFSIHKVRTCIFVLGSLLF